MRNQLITGYILHQKAYRENARLVDFFSQEYGLLRGVLRGATAKSISKGKTSPRQYQLYNAFVDGTGNLKRLSKLEPSIFTPLLQGQALYAGMYLNELLLKLLVLEDSVPNSYINYHNVISQLADVMSTTPHSLLHIKLVLRYFEYHLLHDLGYGICFECDHENNSFQKDAMYYFVHGEGFIIHKQGNIPGAWLCSFLPQQIQTEDVQYLSKILRQSIDELLEYKVLKSRELWASLYNKT